jgi:two-component system osmolarity sensor histidine kinase EnvZ
VKAAESGYERELIPTQAGEIQVRMHPLSIKRVANMVVNAARYGNGWIKSAAGLNSTAPGSRWKTTVRAFKPEQRKHLFQPFVRRQRRSTSGTGLMAIVQRMDNHNGCWRLRQRAGRVEHSRPVRSRKRRVAVQRATLL